MPGSSADRGGKPGDAGAPQDRVYVPQVNAHARRDRSRGRGGAQPQDYLATLIAGPREKRLALAVAAISGVFFLAFAPFAKMPMGELWAFIPVYETALVVSDLVTAVLLFGQFGFLRSRALLVLACAYLFTALMTAVHALSFPGLFAPGGLLGGGPQTTVWLYLFWHAGFPLMVGAYALMPGVDGRAGAGLAVRAGARARARCRRELAAGIALTLAAVLLLSLLVTAGHDTLPQLLAARRYTPAMVLFVSCTWLLSVAALGLLRRRRPCRVLDLWLMVVMCSSLADVALSAMLNASRFDLGFYAGRIYGLLAGSFVMLVLLVDNARLYAQLVRAHEKEHIALKLELEKAVALRAANRELDAFSYSVSHDLRAPLRAVDGYARILQEDYADRLDDEGRRLLNVVREGSRKMGSLIENLLGFSRLGRAPLNTREVSLDELVRAAVEEQRADLGGRELAFDLAPLGQARADPDLLRHALSNLLSNAVKYTRNKANARVAVGCHPGRTADSPTVYFVRDNGAGFDMRYSAKLFGVFERLHHEQDYPGTGVGLAIVQRVINRHGGRVWAEARLGEGATFYFTLQPEPGEAMPPADATEPSAARPAQRLRGDVHP